mmetsp:Transcript_96785/g.172167  ORF Transcript_96785/g.172167 Transcript_96785/m.172167 type:complete len:521 (+) Transcript_96785:93-1655(+)
MRLWLFALTLVSPLVDRLQATGNDHSYLAQDQDECDSQKCPSLDLLQTSHRRMATKSQNTSSPVRYHQILDNDQDTSYTGNISVGGQQLKAIFDTGSYELLLFSALCETCGEAGVNGYDHRLSPYYQPGQLTQSMLFGSGSTTCSDAEEEVDIGPFSVKSQPVWEVLDAEMPILSVAGFQAILGLGPPAAVKLQAEMDIKRVKKIAKSYKNKGRAVPAKIRQALKEQTAADKVMESLDDSVPANIGVHFLSICLEQEHGAQGHLIWNDLDPRSQVRHFSRLKVTGQESWKMALKNVELVGAKGETWAIGCSNGCQAVLDSGTSLISAPIEALEAMTSVLGSLGASCSDEAVLPMLKFNLGGTEHVLPPEVYMGFVEGMEYVNHEEVKVKDCELLMMEIGDEFAGATPLWIMGMPFFRWYTATFVFGQDLYNPHAKKSIWTAPVDEKCNLRNVTDSSTLQNWSASAPPNLSAATEMILRNVSFRPRTVVKEKFRSSTMLANSSQLHKHRWRWPLRRARPLL